MLTAGTPVLVCVMVGWKGIGAACAVASASSTAGAKYITTAMMHAVTRIHRARGEPSSQTGTAKRRAVLALKRASSRPNICKNEGEATIPCISLKRR